jgi:hypothetical protein
LGVRVGIENLAVHVISYARFAVKVRHIQEGEQGLEQRDCHDKPDKYGKDSHEHYNRKNNDPHYEKSRKDFRKVFEGEF